MRETPLASFQDLFGYEARFSGQANGRVVLFGESAALSDGLALTVAIPQSVRTFGRCRPDQDVHVVTRLHPDSRARYQLRSEHRFGLWPDFVQAATWALREAGHEVQGFDLLIESDLPLGLGLGSGAALEIAVLKALKAGFGLKLSDSDLARLGARALSEFALATSAGLIDAHAAVYGRENQALLIDSSGVSPVRFIGIDPNALRLMVVATGPRGPRASARLRADRRAELGDVRRLLGVASLREVTNGQITRLQGLPDPLLRRARHVLSENRRVEEAVLALQASAGERLGDLLEESRASLRDDFEVSAREFETFAEIALEQPDVFGTTICRGTSGGTLVIAAEPRSSFELTSRIARRYQERIGDDPRVLLPVAAGDVDSPRQRPVEVSDLSHI